MRRFLSAVALLAAPATFAAVQESAAQESAVQSPDAAAAPTAITVDDVYRDPGTMRYIYARARMVGDDCYPQIDGRTPLSSFNDLRRGELAAVVHALCRDGGSGFTITREDDIAVTDPIIVIDLDEVGEGVRGWRRMSQQQRGWWQDWIEGHERGHASMWRTVLWQAFNAHPHAARMGEVASDLSGICEAYADTENAMRGPWVQQQALAYRRVDQGSHTHGVLMYLPQLLDDDFANQCAQLGGLSRPEIERGAVRLALTRTLSLAVPQQQTP